MLCSYLNLVSFVSIVKHATNMLDPTNPKEGAGVFTHKMYFGMLLGLHHSYYVVINILGQEKL